MKLYTLFISITLLAGCSSLPMVEQLFASSSDDEVAETSETPDTNNGLFMRADGVVDIGNNASANSGNRSANSGGAPMQGLVDAFGSVNQGANLPFNNSSLNNRHSSQHVGDYVRNMAQDLVANMEFVSERTPVAVTHFSLIDSDLQETNLLGQQMAESFVHEFHKFRMPVVEYKATQFIRVTERGDFVLSRDFLDLKNSTPIQYVLTGTLTKHQGGFIVNARMLGMESNVVVATAQSFIPFYIVDALLPSGSSRQNDMIDGVRIIQGE